MESNMKLLIPTDFSPLSKIAALYAVKLGKKLKAEFVLLNVVNLGNSPGRGAINVKYIEDKLAENAVEDCARLTNEIRSEVKGKLSITSQVVKGYPVENVVANYAQHNHIDLIVMGTKGATGLKKILLGSNATDVINKSRIPVIAVPEFARFTGLKDIVYATDMVNLKDELRAVASFAKDFNATVHVLHILSPTGKAKLDIIQTVAKLTKAMEYNKITVTVSLHEDAAEGIDQYVIRHKADLLVMFTNELTFFRKIVGQSVTREMAFLSNVPLLAFKKE
jgi:nucleotide-binding universal stress UspA family protein